MFKTGEYVTAVVDGKRYRGWVTVSDSRYTQFEEANREPIDPNTVIVRTDTVQVVVPTSAIEVSDF